MVPKNGRPFAQFYTPKKTQEWEDHVADTARTQLMGVQVEGDQDFTLPIRESRILVTLRFNIEKPVSYPKSVVHATKKPDIDNLVKAILDGLVKGRLLEDDNLITDMMVQKRYAGPGHPPGVEVEITALPI